MTREEATEGLLILLRYEDDPVKYLALKMAIKALEQPEPTADQIHTMKEQEYMRGYEDGRKVERESWDEMLVMCDNCGHAIHVKREDVRKPEPCEDVTDTNVGKMDGDALDEAIGHLADDPILRYEGDMKQIAEWLKELKERRKQIAEWLKELKQLRAEKDFSDPPDLESYKHGYVDGFNERAKAQEPCEDAVSREAVYEAMVEKGQHSRRYKLGETWELNGYEIREALDMVLPVTLNQRTGKWIEDEDEMGVICNQCWDKSDWCFDFCPNCGAKMS